MSHFYELADNWEVPFKAVDRRPAPSKKIRKKDFKRPARTCKCGVAISRYNPKNTCYLCTK